MCFRVWAPIPCAVPGRYLPDSTQATAGGNLTYLRDNILYHKDELLAEAEVPDVQSAGSNRGPRPGGREWCVVHALDLG